MNKIFNHASVGIPTNANPRRNMLPGKLISITIIGILVVHMTGIQLNLSQQKDADQADQEAHTLLAKAREVSKDLNVMYKEVESVSSSISNLSKEICTERYVYNSPTVASYVSIKRERKKIDEKKPDDITLREAPLNFPLGYNIINYWVPNSKSAASARKYNDKPILRNDAKTLNLFSRILHAARKGEKYNDEKGFILIQTDKIPYSSSTPPPQKYMMSKAFINNQLATVRAVLESDDYCRYILIIYNAPAIIPDENFITIEIAGNTKRLTYYLDKTAMVNRVCVLDDIDLD